MLKFIVIFKNIICNEKPEVYSTFLLFYPDEMPIPKKKKKKKAKLEEGIEAAEVPKGEVI